MSVTKELMVHFYETMCKIRFFEETVEKHFLAGEIPGFVHLYIGEEAIATGVCSALKNTDKIESTHRGHGHTIAKGANINRAMAEVFGKKTGLCKGKGGSMHIADFSVGMLGANGIVGGGFNLAMGAAFASKMQGKDDVSVVFFGDGASNRGTFHEGANFASAFKLPEIFVLEMNNWASTTNYHETTAVEDISDRAQGYNMPREIVDGNDVFAVYEAAAKAVERARKGGGPTFIECKTYRIKGHFVGDPEMYRSHEETMKIYKETDPITTFEKKVIADKKFTKAELDKIKAGAKKTVEEALEFAMASENPDPSEAFEDLYI
ncbi:MAG: thiamine pyrophosphate-dependent dehydrogenase E1 component subunit alpha [Lachnospiraceae bacterium]|nr:thiamine pyrophosphate-dependent dehydrogenase E1 component subunit alpha [Lachnospiraceae bacterium]